ncbi:MAG: LruC domain-containing protein [Calditrichia bacterium]
MQRRKWVFSLCFTGLIAFMSCGDINSGSGNGDLEAPDDFDFNNTSTMNIIFKAEAADGTPLVQERCRVYKSRDDRENDRNAMMTGFTNTSGIFATSVTVSAAQDSVFLKFNLIGAINEAQASTEETSITFVLGQGINGKRGRMSQRSAPFGASKANSTTPPFKFMGGWSAAGLPNYLEPSVVISAEELNRINEVIPQGVGLVNVYPQYFGSGVSTNVPIEQDGEVFLTFLHTDTSPQNVFAFFSYPTNSPPDSVGDIDSLTVIFPRAHYNAGLASGSKVSLGTFTAGTSIGWAVIRDGWDGSGASSGTDVFYSIDEFNPEPTAYQQHFVLVEDDEVSGMDRLLLTCDDNELVPDNTYYNFDDVIFYITAAEGTFDTDSIPEYPDEPDCDNDGIPDYQDAFPCDENRALQVFVDWQTIAFEDDWPTQGDLDFNDLVVDARYTITCDAYGDITDLIGNFVLRAQGTSNSNGYGFTMPVDPTLVASVTGYSHTSGIISTNVNGTEAGQTDATFIVFDNGMDMMPPNTSGLGVNTERGEQPVEHDTLTMQIVFNTTISPAVMGWPPYNPFMIVDQQRSKEVHLNNHAPTAKADSTLFGTADDVSNASLNQYYRTSSNIPWAMHIPVSWDYPFEEAGVATAHLNFATWLSSGGVSYPDWYLDNSGYRNDSNIYRAFGINKR